jgi:hypothetical protein
MPSGAVWLALGITRWSDGDYGGATGDQSTTRGVVLCSPISNAALVLTGYLDNPWDLEKSKGVRVISM